LAAVFRVWGGGTLEKVWWYVCGRETVLTTNGLMASVNRRELQGASVFLRNDVLARRLEGTQADASLSQDIAFEVSGRMELEQTLADESITTRDDV
jgi:hypothetical protein